MTAEEARARALDELLEGAGKPDASDDGHVRALAELAAALRSLPKPEAPSDAFRAALASRLAEAPESGEERRHHAAETSPPPTTELVRALDHWLEESRTSGADVDELPAELRSLGALAQSLRALPEPAWPSEAFRDTMARRLADAPAPRSVADQAREGTPWLRRLWRSTAFTAAAAATIVLFLAAGATYAAAGTLPGHPLYPIKRAGESARLWLADSATATALHMQYGDRRLDEAFAVPGHSGGMLADFSREATAALVTADGALARGVPRARVAQPLLEWFLTNRVRLIDGREALPPTAWRGALALVDEAIRALSQSRPVAGSPVPRLADPRDLLSARLAARKARPPSTLRRVRPLAADDAAQAPAAPTARPVVVVVANDAAAGRPSGPNPTATPVPQAPAPPEEPAPPRTPGPTRTPKPADTAAPPPSATPSPQPVVPSATPPSATDPVPTATATPPPTATEPGVTPTVPVLNKPPTILEVFCDEPVIELFASTACHVVAVDPEGEPLYYLWASDAPQMVNETQKDAIYYAAWGIGGGKMRVGISVVVADRADFQPDDPDVARASTGIEVRSLDAAGP